MRCAISVDLDTFPSHTHSLALAGAQQGYENCQIFLTRFAAGDRPREIKDTAIERLIFVSSGELSVAADSQKVLLKRQSLIRLPPGTAYSVSATTEAATCVEVIAIAKDQPRESIDLQQLVSVFGGHGPVESSSGFDYTFLAHRKNGSSGVAINIARVLPGHRGPDFHIHKFDQFYFVLSGRLSVDVGFENIVVAPMTLIRLPAGIVHRQGNEGTEPEEHLAIISPEPPSGQPLDYQIEMPVAAE